MRIIISSESLKKAMSSVQSLLTEHQVLLTADADNNLLIVEAGNSGLYLKQMLPAQVLEAGYTVLDSSYINTLKISGSVELTATKDSKLSFKAGKLSGKLETHQSSKSIVDQRPDRLIETNIHLSKDMFSRAIAKTNFSAIMSASQEGLRVKVDENLTLSTTDQWRLSLYKDNLPHKRGSIDFQIKPEVIASVVSKIEDQEVWLGLEGGIIKIASPSLEFYHPTIQTEPTDIEGWLNELDPKDKICEIHTKTTDLIELLAGVSSVCQGITADLKINCTIHRKQFKVEVSAAHGSAKGDFEVDFSTAEEHKVLLSCKYTLEMLSLIKEGDIKIDFYEPYIILTSGDGRCISVVPTATE